MRNGLILPHNSARLRGRPDRDPGSQYDEADSRSHLGETCGAAGDPRAARTAWRRAPAILDRLGHADAHQVFAKIHHPDIIP